MIKHKSLITDWVLILWSPIIFGVVLFFGLFVLSGISKTQALVIIDIYIYFLVFARPHRWVYDIFFNKLQFVHDPRYPHIRYYYGTKFAWENDKGHLYGSYVEKEGNGVVIGSLMHHPSGVIFGCELSHECIIEGLAILGIKDTIPDHKKTFFTSTGKIVCAKDAKYWFEDPDLAVSEKRAIDI